MGWKIAVGVLGTTLVGAVVWFVRFVRFVLGMGDSLTDPSSGKRR